MVLLELLRPKRGQRHAAGSHGMKILRWIERIAHSLGLLLAIVAIVWIGVINHIVNARGGRANEVGIEG